MCQRGCFWDQEQNVVLGIVDELCWNSNYIKEEQREGKAVSISKVKYFGKREISY